MIDSEEKVLAEGTPCQDETPASPQNVGETCASAEALPEADNAEQPETEAASEPETVAEAETTEPEAVSEQPKRKETEAEERPQYKTKAEIIGRLKEIAASDDNPDRAETDRLKAQFYRLHAAQRDEEAKKYVEAGGNPDEYMIEPDPEEEEFKAQMSLIREKRESIRQRLEAERKENLQKKEAIIERIKAMSTSPDEANKCYQEFKSLQQQWREIKSVPAEAATELWRSYQHAVEQFYDLLKLNHEAREYDFKKNLEIKTKLCEAAERLADEPDTLSAFHQLQELHVQYRETGPVAKDQREAVWARFKAASTVINKRHQQYFDNMRAEEGANLARKTEMCERAEAISAEQPTSFAKWDELTRKMIELQKEWKTVGFATQKMNIKIFERFRSACDGFFSRKSEYFRETKKAYSERIERKRALIERARELQDSTEWRSTGDKLIALQKEWREVGFVPKRQGDKLWAEFTEACNHFFDARKAATSGTREEERENLARKREIIARIAELQPSDDVDAADALKQLSDQYAGIGHVPYREKEEIYSLYRKTLDEAHRRLGISQRRRGESAGASTQNRGENGAKDDRQRLIRRYEQLRQELLTYENNLGFLSGTSKQASALLNDLNKKMQSLREEMEKTRQMIDQIDSEEA